MHPFEYNDIFPYDHDFSFEVLIWKASKTYNEVRFYQDAKTIIFVDIWLNSLKGQKSQLANEIQVSKNMADNPAIGAEHRMMEVIERS